MNITKIFENEEQWKTYNPEYKIRKGQIELSKEIYDTIINKRFLIAEAGTGTGKTLAYLIPAILASNKEEDYKILISTETKTLQNQLLKKDIPLVEKVLNIPIKAEVCFGSNNYICKRRLKNFLNSDRIKPHQIDIIEDFLNWEKKSNGIILNYSNNLPKDFITEIVRIPNLCLASRCPNFNHSYYFVEKEKWKKAKILIVNHHLLSMHIESNFSLLPKFNIAIIDEAHSFPNIYRESNILFFSIKELNNFIIKFKLEKFIGESLNELKKDIESIINYKEKNEIKYRIERSLELPSLFNIINKLEEAKSYLEDQFQLRKSSDLFSSKFAIEKNEEEIEIENAIENIKNILNILDLFFEGPTYNRVHYIEYSNDIKFCISYVEVGNILKEKFFNKIDSCILTSATLSIQNNLDYFIDKTGLYEYKNDEDILKTICIPSPYNYKEQAFFYIPDYLEDPSSNEFLHQITKEIYDLIELVNGNTLVIFTSKQNLNYVYKNILTLYKNELKEKGYTIYSQEIYGSEQALQKYIQDSKGILFGLDSYRQGIDLVGDKLKCVILIKLPFSVPTDPIQQRQIEMAREKNKNPFFSIQIPEMIIKLKQSIGRLIRTETDKGIVAILDPRLYTKNYGELILKSLPESTIIKDMFTLKEKYNKNLILRK